MRCIELTIDGPVIAGLHDHLTFPGSPPMRIRVSETVIAQQRASLFRDRLSGAMVLMPERLGDVHGLVVLMQPETITKTVGVGVQRVVIGQTIHSCPFAGGTLFRRNGRKNGVCSTCGSRLLGKVHPVVKPFDEKSNEFLGHVRNVVHNGVMVPSGILVLADTHAIVIETLTKVGTLSVGAWEADGLTGLKRSPMRALPNQATLEQVRG